MLYKVLKSMICLIVKTPAALRTTLSLTQTSRSLSMKFCPQRKAGRRTSPPFFTQFHGPLLDYRRPPHPPGNIKSSDMFFLHTFSKWMVHIYRDIFSEEAKRRSKACKCKRPRQQCWWRKMFVLLVPHVWSTHQCPQSVCQEWF